MADSTRYSSLTSAKQQLSYEENEVEPEHPPRSKTGRAFWETCLYQLFFFGWLGPVLYLLYVNFQERRIGASAWCINGNCRVDWFDPVTTRPEHHLSRNDQWSHNLLGVLQVVSKLLELWFGLIAAALVYLLTFIIAGKKEGIPVGYLTRPYEFTAILGLFSLDGLLWRMLRPLPVVTGSRKRLQFRLAFFFAFTVLLCLISNLMGPAIAVLVIPSLQWVRTGYVGNVTFADHNGAEPAGADSGGFFYQTTLECSADNLTALHYSCAASPFANQLDSWIASYITAWDSLGNDDRGVSQQDTVRFVLNVTSTLGQEKNSDPDPWSYAKTRGDVVHWVPNRQVLKSLSRDRDAIQAISLGYNESYAEEYLSLDDEFSTYMEYNSSMQLVVQRNGPIFGAMVNMWADYNSSSASTTVLDANKAIRCYPDYDMFWTPLVEGTSVGWYTKCIRIGSDWHENNRNRGFKISAAPNSETATNNASASVSILSSDKAVYLDNGTLPSWLPEQCLAHGQVLTGLMCDYDRLFAINHDTDLENRTTNVVTIEMTLPSNDGNSNATLAVDFVAFYDFTSYTLDPSPITNPLYFVQTQDLPKFGTSVMIDPAWILAAWAVDADGTLYSNRTSTVTLMRQLQNLLNDPDAGALDNIDGYDIDYVSLIPIIQAMSMLDWHTDDAVQTNPKKQTAEAKRTHPLIQRNAKLFLWAWGFSSRTSRMGAAVAIAGCLVVLVQFVLGFIDRREYRSLTELLVAALEHVPTGEFEECERKEAKVTKVTFQVDARSEPPESQLLFRKTK